MRKAKLREAMRMDVMDMRMIENITKEADYIPSVDAVTIGKHGL